MKATLGLLLLSLGALQADDVIFMNNGDKRAGQLVSFDEKLIRLQVPLPAPPGSSPGSPQAFASVSIPRSDVAQIEFSSSPARDALLRSVTPAQAAEIETEWIKLSPWLAMPRSPAGKVALAWGDLLLRANDPAQAAKALELFQLVESQTWSDDEKMIARQGRLRAMVATGRAKEAVAEAVELAAITEEPAVLIEAKFILAEADATALRRLVEENPRWQEDIFVRPEHARLLNESLDLYLYPYLFFGSEIEPAARGLWGALQIYDFVGEKSQALECARDLAAIYPNTKYANLAANFVSKLPKEVLAEDPEKQAREDNAPEAKPPADSTEKKTNENKPDKKN
jgi:hypothetical protein